MYNSLTSNDLPVITKSAYLLNGFLLQSEVFKTSGSELGMCKQWLCELNSESISIFDKGFGSATVFSYLVNHNKPFVTRLKVGFNNVVKVKYIY